MRIETDGTSALVPWTVAAWGLIAAILTAPFSAAIIGIAYRFPIPFGDKATGLADALNAAAASVYYLVMGEGFVLAALGGLAGYFIAQALRPRLIFSLVCAVAAAFGISLLAALTLAMLA
ncbi:hypothetical protein ACFVUS_06525 [Nocardia sp. NPDC058058]|uniref:hypothetical protein n=1 Tax=Nocardia sp. NPDC058058 TaxID=3346317 RepID=UPI0036D80F8F